jgi:hypothetical protein
MTNPIQPMEVAAIIQWSTLLDQWAIAMLGGSVAILLTTVSRRPQSALVRCSFLLFLPGWFCLFSSLVLGTNSQRQYRAYLTETDRNEEWLRHFLMDDGWRQEQWFQYAVIAFGLWLLLLLLYWVLAKPDHTNGAQ